LAEAYTLFRSNQEFADRKEEMEFFRTKGISHYLKKDDSDPSTITRPLTPLDENTSPEYSLHYSDQSTSVESIPEPDESGRSSFQDDVVSPTSSQSTPSENSNPDRSAVEKTKSRKRKPPSDMQLFDDKTWKLTEFITAGKSDKHLLDIYHLKIHSLR